MAGKPFFVRPLSLGTIATNDAVAGYPVTHLDRREAMGLVWRAAAGTGAWARGQLAAGQSIDFISMVAANAQVGTTIRVRLGTSQAQVDGTAPYDSGALTFISPATTRESGLYNSHLELGSAVTASWWRIDIGGHSGAFEAGGLVLGKKITPTRYYNSDFEYGVEDLGSADLTRFGVMDEEPGVILRTIGFTLAWQTEAEWETSFRPMQEALGKRGILFCCFDPDANAYRQARTYMGLLRKPPFARGTRMNNMLSQDFELLSFI